MFTEYYELNPEESWFTTIFADITHACNMACANCYVPNRTMPEMNFEKFVETISKLPKRTEIRLAGGEPTLNKKLGNFIQETRRLGHRPVLITNGLLCANLEYLKKLKEAGLRTIYISMNGADDDRYYKITDSGAFAEKKVAALKNASLLGLRIGVGCILQRGANEMAPTKLLNLIIKNKIENASLRFRNVGQIGRYSQGKDQAYSFHEVEEIISTQFEIPLEEMRKSYFAGDNDRKTVFFNFKNHKTNNQTILVSITNWNSLDNDPNPMEREVRGRITEAFKIAPYFEHIKKNEFGY